MSEIHVRAYRPGDEHGILAMYRSVFDLDFSVETWRSFYESFPHGPAIIVVAELERELVGHYAVQPRPFWCGGDDCLAGFVLGTMIEQKARNVTLFVDMARLAYELCTDRGLRFVYAFPRDDIMRIRQTLLSWQTHAKMVEWEGPLPPVIDELPVDVQDSYSITEKPLELLARPQVVDAATIRGQRYAEWVNWRIFENPRFEYDVHTIGDPQKPDAYAVTKLYRRGDVPYGHIVDWHVVGEDPTVVDGLLAGIWRQFHEKKVERFSCWANRQNSLGKAMHEAGYEEQGQSANWGYLPLESASQELLADRDAWHIFMVDTDSY